MVKNRRHLLPASLCSASHWSSTPSSPAASLSLTPHPLSLKHSSAACSPFISSFKRFPVLDIHAEFSTLGLGSGKGATWREDNSTELEPELGGSRDHNFGRKAADCGGTAAGYSCGQARQQHYWIQVGGKVMIPDTWALEQHLQEWVSFGLVEESLKPAGLMSARSALVADSVAQRRLRGSSSAAATSCSAAPSLEQPAPSQLRVTAADTVEVSSCG